MRHQGFASAGKPAFLGYRSSGRELGLILIAIALASGRSIALDIVYIDSPDVCITNFASGTYQAEPSVFVDPSQPGYLLVTANTWTAPAYTETRVSPCVSGNAGASWQCQTTAIIPLAYGDPASIITMNSRYYGMFIHDFSGPGNQGLAVSTSDGAPGTWNESQFPGFGPPTGYLDRGHLCVDNSLATPHLYAAWTNQDPNSGNNRKVEFRHALEGPTLFWLPTPGPIVISDVTGRNANSQDFAVHLESGPSNRVFACWSNGPSAFTGDRLGFARSVDNGTSWPLKKYIDSVIDGGVPKSMQIEAPGHVGGSGSSTPNPGITPCMAYSPASDELLLVWTNKGSPLDGLGDSDIWFIKSPGPGFGDTWYGPVRVNQIASGAQWNPWITVDDATGAIAVLYYDSRDHSPFAAEAYISVSNDGGEHWTDIRISDGGPGIPPAASYSAFVSNGGIGNDYLGIMAQDGLAYPVWTDDRDRLPSDSCPPLPQQDCTSGPALPWKVYTSPILLGGIDATTILPIIGQSCAGVGNPRVRFEVDWSTVISMNGPDKLTVIPPGQAPIIVSSTSISTAHQLVCYDIPCVTGNWAYVVESNKWQGISRSDTLYSWVSCMSCPPACHPPCELE